MKVYLGKHTETGVITAQPGISTCSVAIPFVPNYIKVKFAGSMTVCKGELLGEDQVFWNLVKVSPSAYRLDIGWSVYGRREVHYQAAYLNVAPV